MKCSICGSNGVKGNSEYVYCPACGVGRYDPIKPGRVDKRRKQSFLDKMIVVLLLKLYRLVSWFEEKLEGEIRKPRLGNL